MTREDLIVVINTLGDILDANANQRMTEALVRGVMLVLEQRLAGRVVQQEAPPPQECAA